MCLDDQQKTQFFVTLRSLNHADVKWKKIITFGEKSWTNLPFHYIVPSHSTALKDGVSGGKVIDFQLLLTAGSDSTTAWIETQTYYFLSKLEVKWHILLHYLVQLYSFKKYPRMIQKTFKNGTYKYKLSRYHSRTNKL